MRSIVHGSSKFLKKESPPPVTTGTYEPPVFGIVIQPYLAAQQTSPFSTAASSSTLSSSSTSVDLSPRDLPALKSSLPTGEHGMFRYWVLVADFDGSFSVTIVHANGSNVIDDKNIPHYPSEAIITLYEFSAVKKGVFASIMANLQAKHIAPRGGAVTHHNPSNYTMRDIDSALLAKASTEILRIINGNMLDSYQTWTLTGSEFAIIRRIRVMTTTTRTSSGGTNHQGGSTGSTASATTKSPVLSPVLSPVMSPIISPQTSPPTTRHKHPKDMLTKSRSADYPTSAPVESPLSLSAKTVKSEMSSPPKKDLNAMGVIVLGSNKFHEIGKDAKRK